jgi:hypothetical protein
MKKVNSFMVPSCGIALTEKNTVVLLSKLEICSMLTVEWS